MNTSVDNVENRLSERLAKLADTAEVRFTLDDVVAGVSPAKPVSPARRRQQRGLAFPLVLAVAAAVVVTAGTVAWLQLGASQETVTAPTAEADANSATDDLPGPTVPTTQLGCEGTALATDGQFPMEIPAISAQGEIEVWGLPFNTEPTPSQEAFQMWAGEELKVVWRVTGEGPVAFRAFGPDGQEVDPLWGPEHHSGSDWDRPGDEWGTGWVLPEPGCWQIEIRRDTDFAVVEVGVIEPR